MISFDRPTNTQFFGWEYYYVLWLEKYAQENGFTVDYASNFDVHNEPELLTPYKLVVSVGHDEYWTKEQFESFYQRIFERGQNVLFLNGNTAYWQVRYADINGIYDDEFRGRQMICFKSMHDPVVNRPGSENPLALPTALFREEQRMPESMLMGVAYEDWFRGDKSYHYEITDVSLPIFSNTGFKVGDEVKSIVGYEWDNTDPQRDGQRLWSKKNSLIPEIPKEDIQVLFKGKPINNAGKEGLAQAVFFGTPSGAKVFSAGTMRWPWALSKPGYVDERFQRLNENLHKLMLK